jgi:hypothetical protein
MELLYGASDDSACMAASASYDDSMTTPTRKSSFNINHNNLNSTSNIQIGMRQKTIEMVCFYLHLLITFIGLFILICLLSLFS